MVADRPGRPSAGRRVAAALLARLLLLLLVAGCADSRQPMGPAVTAARLEPDAVIAADGARLPLRAWLPAAAPRAVILALHGFNDYSQAFAEPGAWLADRGIATYAYDQRGFGQAPRPGIWPGGATLTADLRSAADLLHRRWPGVPLYLLGESMGGAVVVTALAEPAPAGQPPLRAAGAILVAPALWSREVMGPLYRVTLWLADNLVPWLALTAPRELHIMPSDNLDMLRALSRDPLVIKETRVDAVRGLVDLMTDGLDAVPRLTLPCLVLYGDHEQVLARDAVSAALARFALIRPPGPARSGPQIPDVRVAVYPRGYHMLLRDLQRQTVWQDIAAWLDDRSQPLPSGADRQPWRLQPPESPTRTSSEAVATLVRPDGLH